MRLVALIALLLFCSCQNFDSRSGKEEGAGDDSLVVAPFPPENPDWEKYASPDFHFSLRRPASWSVVENRPGNALRAFNVYHPTTELNIELPLTVHSPGLSHLSFYPEGWSTELPSGKNKKLSELPGAPPVRFEWDSENSFVFLLEDGSPWAYLINPAQAPPGWNEEGYLFAQVAVHDFSAHCFDRQTGEPKNMEYCDPLMGDRVERRGRLDQAQQALILDVLASIYFFGESESDERLPIDELLQIEQPLSNQDVQSPLLVKGKARGYWYQEATFSISLLDKDYNTLARTNAEAQGNWMTEDFVPFEATLQFDSPGDERGYLLFEKANPSGLPEKERQFRLPVAFE